MGNTGKPIAERGQLGEEIMEQLQEELGTALQMLSYIPVSGDGVDYMAAAKQRIRRALKLAETERKDVTPKDGG